MTYGKIGRHYQHLHGSGFSVVWSAMPCAYGAAIS